MLSKIFRLLAIALALSCIQAHAALSSYGSPGDTNGASPQTRTFTTAVANGDLMIAKIEAGTGTPPMLADNVSTGSNWVLVSGTGQPDGTSGYYYYWFWKVMNVTSGTPPTLTATSSGYINDINVIAMTGFVGSPSFDATNTNLQTGTGTTASTTQTTGYTGEILLAMWFGTLGYFTGAPTGWSNWPASNWPSVLIGPEPAGTNANTSWSPSTSTFWVQSMIGVYDSGTASVAGAAYDVNHITASQWIPVSTSQALPVTGAGELRYECNASSGTVTLTLPTAVLNFNTYRLKKIDSSVNACKFATTSSQTIDGASTKSLTSQYTPTVSVSSNNANWDIN